MVMEEMGQIYELIAYSDVGSIAMGMKTGTRHSALAVPDVPDYKAMLNLSIPYEILHYVTFVQKGNTDISGATKEELIRSFYGKRVGVQVQGHIYQVRLILVIIPVLVIVFGATTVTTSIFSTSALENQAKENAKLLSHSYADQLTSIYISVRISVTL